MKAAVDVYYKLHRAIAACVMFHDWSDSKPAKLIRVVVSKPPPYRAGRFYERELAGLIAVLEQSRCEFETILIDGYVHLRPDVGYGLGAHLHQSLSYSPAIIGVAKNPLAVADRYVSILRGRSIKPLYISATGCSLKQAAQHVGSMHGSYRIPTLLKLADQCSRSD